jgi:hypothetical protein
MITSFVLVMMLMIEYINVQTKGKWSKPFQKYSWMQIIVAAIIGIMPGCLGSYAIVSLYTHNIFNFGALVSAMIATTGDESYVMFSMIPNTALKLNIILFVLAIIAGFAVNFFFKKKQWYGKNEKHFTIHDHHEEHCHCYKKKTVIEQLKNITFHRAILIFGLVLFTVALISGSLSHSHSEHASVNISVDSEHIEMHDTHEHTAECAHGETAIAEDNHNHSGEISLMQHGDEWDWVRITFLLSALFTLFIVITVPDHFLQEHLWGHIIKKHFLKIFLWTIGALLLIHGLMEYLDFGAWAKANPLIILSLALVIGIIPESGPHLIFVSMFAQGAIPFSILMANSIVQDGHGALPLLAESNRSFLIMKLVKIIIALAFGLSGYLMGW